MLDHCIYCGDWFGCKDYVIPVNYRQTYQDFKPGSTVKCCTECNCFLGNKPYHTIESTAKYLITAYIQNRKKDLNFPKWEERELRGLGYNLRTRAEGKLARKKVYMWKLENLELVSKGFECKPFRYSLDKESNIKLASSRKCLSCAMVFFNVKKNDFCSQYCNGRHKAKLVAEKFRGISETEAEKRLEERNCLVCEVYLKTSNRNAFFCSKTCIQALNKHLVPLVRVRNKQFDTN